LNAIQRLFSPLLGKLAWGYRQTHGSCFFVEFGEPHVETSGPFQIDESASESRLQRARRRRVFLHGEASLLVTLCSWELCAWEIHVTHDHGPDAMKSAFDAASGQYLKSVGYDEASRTISFEFDLGARLRLWPGQGYEATDVQWTLSDRYGTHTSLLNNGEISIHIEDSAGRTA
jgi:hypothetical protein